MKMKSITIPSTRRSKVTTTTNCSNTTTTNHLVPGIITKLLAGVFVFLAFGTQQSWGKDPAKNPVKPPVDYYVNDGSTSGDVFTGAVGNDSNPGTAGAPFLTIAHALSVAGGGNTIYIDAGTYVEIGQLVINKNLTITGANKNIVIIKPAQNTGDPSSGDARGWWLIQPGFTLALSNVTLDGAGKLIYMGVYYWGNGSVNNCIIKNIKYNESGPEYQGRGMILKGNVNVTNCNISEVGRIGIQYFGGNGTANGNTITGKGAGAWLDYGIETGNGSVNTITNNYITNCKGVVGPSGSAAVLNTTFFGPGTTATIENNILTGNAEGIHVGQDGTDASTVTAHNNDLSGNSDFAVVSTAPAVNATCNWLGSTNPATNAAEISGPVSYIPWLSSGADLGGNPNDGFQPSVPCSTDSWLGTTSTDWFNASNWSGGIVPTALTDVTIPPVGGTVLYQPVIGSGTANAHNLIINASATLTINSGATLDLNGGGVVTNHGTLTNLGTFNQ
jgi:hypothetical protein